MKRTELARGPVRLSRTTPLRRTSVRKRPSAPAGATKTGDWSPSTREAVQRRSQGQCEVCDSQPATDMHHRRRRKERDHRVVTALHCCRTCHRGIHAHPAEARTYGWITYSTADPASVPLLIHGNRWVVLQPNGTYRTHADSYGDVA